MFEHLHWANQRILDALRVNTDNERALQLFAHILHVEQVWFTRLTGKDSSHIPLWPDADLSVCSQLVDLNNENYSAYLADMKTNGNLDAEISYKSQNGESFKSSVHDILTQVALHGHYHRGQINSMLRTAGNEPVNVDYITYVRLNGIGTEQK